MKSLFAAINSCLLLGFLFNLAACQSKDGAQRHPMAPLPAQLAHNPSEQINFLTNVLEDEPENHYMLFQRSVANLNVKRVNQAYRDIKSAQTLAGKSTPAAYFEQEARVELARENYQKALEAAKIAQGRGRKSKALDALLGQLFFLNGQPAFALPYLETALPALPQDKALRFSLASIYAQQNDTTRAVPMFKSLIATWPDFLDAYNCLMELHLTNNNPEKSLEIARKLPNDLDPDADFSLLVAKGLEKQNQPDSAAVWYQVAAAKDPLRWEPLYRLGLASIQKKNFLQAGAYLKKATALNPELHEASYQVGLLEELHSGNLNEALKYYQMAIRQDSSNAEYQRAEARLQRKLRIQQYNSPAQSIQ